DDLQKIEGIGPLIEQKLHQIGIYTYGQISNMTDEDFELLDEILDTYPVYEHREVWKTQANQLKNNQ
ncbi:MAG TPA: molybdopterin oxidoreductase, partial [Salinimicrobium sp.]|nr:molybdopterin oxidoreductase [Salinimicrobium sp.]